MSLLLPILLLSSQQAAKPSTVPAVAIKPVVDSRTAIDVDLTASPRALDMEHLKKYRSGYFPSSTSLVATKPAGIVKEPAYVGTPKYGAVRLGDGPRAVTYFVIDEVQGGATKIYLDLNTNGDLTDDGEATWDTAKEAEGVVNLMKVATFRASYGDALTERETAPYGLMLYRRVGDDRLNYARISGREGVVTVAGKKIPILLAENQADGLYVVPRTGDTTRKPVWLYLDEKGDGTFSSGMKSIDRPFQIDGQWWEAFPNLTGSKLTLRPSNAAGTPPPVAAATPSKPLLAKNAVAPDFTAATPDGKPIHLSDFKGKIVILDFWATWCGPCQVSMPGLQKIYDQVKAQNVVVLSLNVWDTKTPFDGWIAKNSGTKYNFTFAFDAAGRDPSNIAKSKFNVNGIPTLYIIKPDGKVQTAIVGSGNEANIVKALGELGVKASVPAPEQR